MTRETYLCPVCHELALPGVLHRERNDGVSPICKGSLAPGWRTP